MLLYKKNLLLGSHLEPLKKIMNEIDNDNENEWLQMNMTEMISSDILFPVYMKLARVSKTVWFVSTANKQEKII